MNRLIAWLPILLICFATSVFADPPAKVARLSYKQGSVTFAAAGSQKWAYATLNRPLIAGDRIWANKNSKAEIQLGGAVIHINQLTSLGIFKLNKRLAQIQITQGTFNLIVRNNSSNITYEIDTPQLALVITKPGDYRVDVDRISTKISIRSGQSIVYGKTASYRLREKMSYLFKGNNLNPYQMFKLPRLDAFDHWIRKHDRSVNRINHTLKYVSQDMIGYEDLDRYGTWEETNEYGHVWVPSHRPKNWAPYRYGHWEWVSPWGWTWIDNEAWGFAPFHYGRWVSLDGSWAWVPGPRYVEPVYAPALVAFVKVGKAKFWFGSDNRMAWIPLGPRDVYVPPYSVSKNYFTNVNVSNTSIVNNTNVINVYNNQTTVINYQNKQAADAVTVVSKDVVVAAKPVAPALMLISKEIDKTPLIPLTKLPVESTPLNVPSTQLTEIKPPKEAESTPVVVKTPAESAPTEEHNNKPMAEEKSGVIAVPFIPSSETKEIPVKPLSESSSEPTLIIKPELDKSVKEVPHLPKSETETLPLQPVTKPTIDEAPIELIRVEPQPEPVEVTPTPEPAPTPVEVASAPQPEPQPELAPIEATPEPQPEPEPAPTPVEVASAPQPEPQPELAPIEATPEPEPAPIPVEVAPAPQAEPQPVPAPIEATPSPQPPPE